MGCWPPSRPRPTRRPRWRWWTSTRPASPATTSTWPARRRPRSGPEQAILPAGTTALHIGSLGLVMEPVGTSLEQLVAALPAGITVMLDPNCRPGAIASRQAYLDRLDRILRRVDLVKTSTEDLSLPVPRPGHRTGRRGTARPGACLRGGHRRRGRRACFRRGPGDPRRGPAGQGRRHGGRRGRVRRRLPRLVDRQRVRPGRPARPGHGAPRDPCGDLRLGGDLHAPRRGTAVGLRAGRPRRLAVAAPGESGSSPRGG